MPSVQKVAFGVGIVLLAGTALIKLDILRPGPDRRSMEERQAAALRVRVAKIRETNAAAEKRLAELQRELEAQLAATLAIKSDIALSSLKMGLPAPEGSAARPAPPSPPAEGRNRSHYAREAFERQIAQNRTRLEGRLRLLGLTRGELDRVLELLTAEASPTMAMVSRGQSEAMPTLAEVTDFRAKAQAELQELLGPQGVELMAQLGAEAIQGESAEEAVRRVAQDGGGRLSDAADEATRALARTLHGNKLLGTIVSERQPWSAESEARIRGDRAVLWAQWVAREGAIVSPVEQARIKAWFDQRTEENLSQMASLVRRMRGQPQP